MKPFQKALIAAGGVTGAGVAAWQALCPWIEHDLKLMKAARRLMKVRAWGVLEATT